jgi:AraC-like DNA-binding protein
MIPTFHVHYSGPTIGGRYEQWREEFARKWIPSDFDPIDSDLFVNDLTGSMHSFLTICTTRGTPAHMTARSKDLPSASTSYLYLSMALETHLQVEQRRGLHNVPPGHMALLSAEESATVSQLTAGTRTSLRIPRKLLADITLLLDDKVGKPIAAAPQLRHLLTHQVELAQRLGPKLDSATNFAIAQHILDLASLCIGAQRDALELVSRRGLAAARLDAIKADIINNFATSNFRLASIASRHKVSERYVQYLFEKTGTSFSAYVLEQRLLNVWKVLRNPTSRWRKISDIASAAGFSDISYFNRAFRARFGATPGDVRVAAGLCDEVH